MSHIMRLNSAAEAKTPADWLIDWFIDALYVLRILRAMFECAIHHQNISIHYNAVYAGKRLENVSSTGTQA